MKAFATTIDFLRHYAYNDVLMPVVPNEKRPMFLHQGGRWSWTKLCEYVASTPLTDACVLLTDLCVVDVDSVALAEELELRFPWLLDVPCEHTPRGRHYWFRRSELCDAEGFYDGRSQIIDGIDFKTRCANGTSGIVVVAPDTPHNPRNQQARGRVWVQRMEADTLCPIPDVLLRAVAVPRHSSFKRTFKFQDYSENGSDVGEMKLAVRHLDVMAYFEPFICHDFHFQDEVIPVPCTSKEFLGLLDVLDNKTPAGHDYGEAVRVADKLGLSFDLRRRVLDGDALWRMDLDRAWPEMAEAISAETAWLNDNTLPQVCTPVTTPIFYKPLAHIHDDDPRWVFDKHLWTMAAKTPERHVYYRERDTSKITQMMRAMCILPPCLNLPEPPEPTEPPEPPETQRVVAKPTDFATRLPSQVVQLMQAFPLVLAGGMVLGMLSNVGFCTKYDHDLFVYGLDETAADNMLKVIVSDFLRDDEWSCVRTSRAHTFVQKDSDAPFIIQIILKLYDTPEQVPLSFDFGPCKVATWVRRDEEYIVALSSLFGPSDSEPSLSSESPDFVVVAAPSWFEAMGRLAFVVDPTKWGKASVSRTCKYVAKGFRAFLPGLRRSFVEKSHLAPCRGIACLLYAEGVVLRATKGDRSIINLRQSVIRGVAWAVAGHCSSDYESELKTSSSNRLAHTINGVARRGIRAITQLSARFLGTTCGTEGTGSSNTQARSTTTNMSLWPRFDNTSVVMQPDNPRLWRLHSFDKAGFEKLACKQLGMS